LVVYVHYLGGGRKEFTLGPLLGPRGGGLPRVTEQVPQPKRSIRVLVLSRDSSVRSQVHRALELAGCAVISREGFRPSDLTAQPPFHLVLAGATLFPDAPGLILFQALRDAFSRSRFALLFEAEDPWLLDQAEHSGLSTVQLAPGPTELTSLVGVGPAEMPLASLPIEPRTRLSPSWRFHPRQLV